jgi:hypothetical protein
MNVESLEYILEQLGSSRFKRSGDNLTCDCPLAPWTHDSGHDKGRKFGALITEGMSPANCFIPGCFSGTIYDAVVKAGGYRVRDGLMTAEQLNDLKAFTIMAEDDEMGESAFIARQVALIPASILVALGTGSPYWVGRGLDPEEAKAYGEAEARAWLPLRDKKGEVVAVQGRLLPGETDPDTQDAKYRTYPNGFLKSEHLFGEHRLVRPVDFLVVVEAPASAEALSGWLKRPDWQDVLPYGASTEGAVAVATMGAKWSEEQMRLILGSLTLRGEVCIAFDADNEGRLATWGVERSGIEHPGLMEHLRRRVPRVTVVEWPKTDPLDKLTPDEPVDALRERARLAVRDRKSWLALKYAKLTSQRRHRARR